MATYKITYLIGDSYSSKNEHYINNVYDEYDATEKMLNEYNISPHDVRILSVEFICE